MISTATSSSISRPLELIVSSNSTDKQLDPSGGLLFGETKPAFSGIAIQDYESDIPERLQLRQGDVIQILMPTDPENNNSDQDWWYGRLESGGPYGWVPARCCRYYQNVQDWEEFHIYLSLYIHSTTHYVRFLSFFSLLLLLLFTSYYIYNQKATCSTISFIEGYGRKVTCCFWRGTKPGTGENLRLRMRIDRSTLNSIKANRYPIHWRPPARNGR